MERKVSATNLAKDKPQRPDLQVPVACFSLLFCTIKSRVKCVEVFLIQSILYDAQGFTEPLEMHNLTHPQEFNRFTDIRIVYQTKDVVVSGTGLLFCYTVILTT